MKFIKNIKYLLLRRIAQLSFMFLYFGANTYGWSILKGNFGTAYIFNTIPLADPYNILQVLATGFMLGADVLIGGLVIVMFYSIIGGRAFCSWVCPINMITDLANYLRRFTKLDNDEVKYRFMKRSSKYWIMFVGLCVSFILGISAFESISPIGIMQRGIIFGFGMGGFILLCIFLFDLFGVKNGWCGHLCPLGAMYSIIGAKNLIRVKHNAQKCTGCNECVNVCPEPQVLDMVNKRNEFVSKLACVNCGRCVDVCNDDANSFSIRALKDLK
jgi:ferredoxin-type protein NapH